MGRTGEPTSYPFSATPDTSTGRQASEMPNPQPQKNNH